MNMDGHTENILNRQWQLRGNFNEQVAKLIKAVRMTSQQKDGLQILYYDLEEMLWTIWPGCHMEVFGSVLSGLALQNSDVDCFVTNCEDEPVVCVEKCRDLIADGAGPFRKAAVTIKRVPTVQFLHTETGRRCDLSFNKPTAVEFNKLVGSLLAMDARAPKLAMIIKCWAKIHNVTGRRRLPSNALIILIIFFLQLMEVLPPVAALQRNVAPYMIEGWNTAFTNIRNYRSGNCQSAYNLLREFFAFYAHFDFRDLVVCPYLGYELERGQFESLGNVPPEFRLYKKNIKAGRCETFYVNCILCIQDPFEHARNCAGPVRPKEAGEIVQSFREAALVCESSSQRTILNILLSSRRTEPPLERHWPQPPSRSPHTDRRSRRRATPYHKYPQKKNYFSQ